MQREIYFDNSATTKPFDDVVELVTRTYKETYGNPSAMHLSGIKAERVVKVAREKIAETLAVKPSEIIFTSGGTESNNFAIKGLLEGNPRFGNHILTTKIEHPSILEVFRYLSKKGYEVEYLDVDESGRIDLDILKSKIKQTTSLISVMYVNNETGAIQPIRKIVDIKDSIKKDIKVHVDAVQAYGKISIKPYSLGIDMMSFSSHKIHGPKGIGGLFVKKGIRLAPQMLGGGQENLLRSGTENVPGIAGFGLAAEIMDRNIHTNMQKVENLKKVFVHELKKCNIEYEVLSCDGSLPYILNVSFLNTKSEVMLHHLEQKGIFVSTGSACSSRKKVHSHVLEAMKVKSTVIDGAIRFSFSVFNTEDEVVDTINMIKEIVPVIYIKRGGKK